MTNNEIYELLEQNAKFIRQFDDNSSIIKHILETQNKILREMIANLPEAGNDNTVRMGD